MAVSQDAFNEEEFAKRMMKVLPELHNGKYLGKRLTFPFAHPDTRVEFSRTDLKQELPGKVFELSHPECPMECAEHEERLHSVVRDCYDQVADKENGFLELRFGKILIRKKQLSNDMSVQEIDQILTQRWWDMRVNVRSQYMLNDDDKILNTFERLGAVKKSEETLDDELIISLNIAPLSICLNPNTMSLSGIIQAYLFGKQNCLPFPTGPKQTEHNFDGLTLKPRRIREIEIDKLCGMCTDDATLLSILRTPGLGLLSKKQDPERFVIHEANVDSISCMFFLYDWVRYSFDMHGVKVVLNSWSSVNHSFESDETESKVHQRIPGRDIRIAFHRNEHLSVDNFVAAVARIISALKNAVCDGEVRLAMHEVVERMENRFLEEVLFNSPKWCLSPSQWYAREEFRRRCMLNSPPNPADHSATVAHDQKHTQSEASSAAILKPIREGSTLEEMLEVPLGVHSITILRASMRRLLKKIDEMSQWSPESLLAAGLDANGQDLTRLKQKLLDAAAERNLSF